MNSMRINTLVRKENEKTATKILRKGRGAWGDFVNKALEEYANPPMIIYKGDTPPEIVRREEYKIK